jgi:predicted esterase
VDAKQGSSDKWVSLTPSGRGRGGLVRVLPPLFAALTACGAAPSQESGEPADGDASESSATPSPATPPSTSSSGQEPQRTPEGNPVFDGIADADEEPPSPPNAPAEPSPSATAPTTPVTGSAAPIIPEPTGPCPEFVTGTQQILGLTTEIVAGAPGPAKGPLLFTWHGTGGTGRQALLQLPQSVQRDIVSRGGLVIAPSDNGQVRSGADVTFVLGVWYAGADLDYADQLVACAVQNHNIDPRQIYVTGCSAGGLMAGVMSMERSSYVAAAAPNSGGVAAPTFRVQDRERIPAVMTLHGGANDNVIVNFGDTSRALADALTPLGAFVVECNHGSGHCGAPPSLHEAAWEFMLAHPFGTQPSPYAQGLPTSFPEFCEIQ